MSVQLTVMRTGADREPADNNGCGPLHTRTHTHTHTYTHTHTHGGGV
jgi:hypothetical protein